MPNEKRSKSLSLAFDKASARTIDKDGRMHVSRSNISKANVCPYMGKEIPGWQSLGLDANKIYRLYRDPEELAKGAATFNNLPILLDHTYVSAEKPEKERVIGSMSGVEFGDPYLAADLCFWDKAVIDAINEEAIEELSSAYHYKADMTPGTTPEGEAFDGVMRDIVGNHLALVEKGRAGSDVIVADSANEILWHQLAKASSDDLVTLIRQKLKTPQEAFAALGIDPVLAFSVGGLRNVTAADSDPFYKKESAMKQTKLGKALMVTLSAASPKIAQDSALLGLVGGAVKKTFDKQKVIQAICAMDEDIDAEKADEIIDAVLGVEEEPKPTEPKPVMDEDDGGAKSKHAEIIDYLKSKGLDASDLEAVGNMLTRMDRPYASDEDVQAKVEEEVKTAADSLRQEIKQHYAELDKARSAVRPVVGEVIGMDSAADVYKFALKHMNVDFAGMPDAGLSKLFAVAATKKSEPSRPVAMDSASVKKAIPGLDRFRTA